MASSNNANNIRNYLCKSMCIYLSTKISKAFMALEISIINLLDKYYFTNKTWF